MNFRKNQVRRETYAERAQREEMERQREISKRVFQVLEIMPTDFVCPACQGQPYALFCDPCSQKVREKARV